MLILTGVVFAGTISSCGDDEDNWDQYKQWITENNSWLEEKANEVDPTTGQKVYTRVIPSYNVGSYVLMRWFNDQSKTSMNLKPMFTSTVDVKYIGHLYDNTPFDSSYLLTSDGDSIFRTDLSSVIQGWQIALQNMHVGDSCEVIIPFASAYGSSTSGIIPPYSNLRFNMALKDIYTYEIR
ncbi:MAG: FKBP-type peptidyl-prolyl cis-trans isomerase [Muribaculaceae bacterium]|nr:FKBP-type peptidyl-prolyl cis-trans isomerase [Muribaculaceae bacterium]